MNSNRVKWMLKRGEIAFGTWVSIGNPDVAEILANLGFDWLVFDTEHGPLSIETVESMIQATSGTDVVPLIRVGGNDMILIKRALDIGAYGVVVPLVNNREDAKNAVAYTRYPPKGVRGAGPRRCSMYGMRAKEYFDWADREILTIVQVETAQAVENIEEIITVDGVDVFFIGPTDLTTSLGVRGEQDHPKFIEALDRVLEAGREHGVSGGIMTYSLEQARRALERGFKFVTLSVDFRHLIQGAKGMLEAVRGTERKTS
ncbi:HpcH/HpaI aldolase family protein [[Eubacterium] cellulosolvens]